MINRGEKVLNLAKKIVRELKPYCKRIEIAGSIRRKKLNPGDIDIVLVSKNEKSKEVIKEKLSDEGKFLQGGDKKMFFRIDKVNVQLFFAESDEWGATLLAYSGEKGANIGLRIVAEKQGFKLTSHGLFRNSSGKSVAGKTEREIYKALGRPYKEPGDR